MNNEPVAWMEADVLPLTHIIKAVVRREQDEQHTIPLYTHPADAEKVKENMDKVLKQNERLIEALANARIAFDAEIEKKNTLLKMWEVTHPAKTLTPLTDDEIEIECRKAWNLNDQYRLNLEEVIRFAHAILRKAQEK